MEELEVRDNLILFECQTFFPFSSAISWHQNNVTFVFLFCFVFSNKLENDEFVSVINRMSIVRAEK